MLDAVQARNSTARLGGLDISRSDVLIGIVLVLVMIAGGYFRFVGQNWDDFTHLHPDERFLTDVASSLNGSLQSSEGDPIKAQMQIQDCMARYPATNGVGGFFDAQCSTWNPHNANNRFGRYVYGTLPLFLARWTGDFVSGMTDDNVWSGYNGVHLVWRALSASFDMGVILIVFFIGLQLHGRWAGLLAAILYAAMVLPIQKAHFGTVNATTSFFVALGLLFAARVQDKGGLLNYVGFGVALAAAVAGRINTAPLAGIIIVATVVRALPALDSGLSWRERERIIGQSLVGLALAGIAALVAFRFFNPYAFMGPGIFGLQINPRWIEDLQAGSYGVSGLAESPPNWQWTGRTSYLFPFTNMVLWGMGVPLGLTAWGSFLVAGWRLFRGKAGGIRNVLPFVWILGYFAWIGGIWVMSMRYYLPLYPAFAVLAGWGLYALVRWAHDALAPNWRKAVAWAVVIGVVGFSYLWAAMFTNIYRNQLTRVQASNWVWEQIPGDFAMRVDDAPPETPLMNIAVSNRPALNEQTPLSDQVSRYDDGDSSTFTFRATATGTVSSVHAPHISDISQDDLPESLRITITDSAGNLLSEAELTDDFNDSDHAFGDAYDIPLEPVLEVEEGQSYIFTVEAVSGGPFSTAGSILSWEGQWDDPVPTTVCTLPPGMSSATNPPPGMFSVDTCNGRNAWAGLVNGYQMYMSADEVQFKRDIMIESLENSDYIIISSNRFYDAEARIPIRWPMTLKYYDALFSGELGFELAALFDETFQLGPLRISDQYLPIYNGPEWLNEFEAEEAFHVYDHPAVFIYRKTDAFDAQKMRDLLNSVPLNRPEDAVGGFNCPNNPSNSVCDPTLIGVVPLYSLPADPAPTQLQLTPDLRQMQYNNGTWSNRFDTSSPVNSNPAITVALWWLTIMLFGWVAWPLLFGLLPGLADGGYGLAKMAGMLLVGWLAWFVSSARVPMWSQTGVGLALLAIAILSIIVALRQRTRLVAFLQEHWRLLLGVEMITLICFLVFLAIRMSNPDLWHPSFGGEKPMDFAYFNGVLRSSVFPPLDPWYTGGFINYYYFGFVIVGAPTLLLGVVPSVAYNLIIPTLFALTGITAFSAAFNVVAAWKERTPINFENETGMRRLGNPWAAGIVALLLAAVLGNLDTPRVFVDGLARLGGYTPVNSLEEYMVRDYTRTYGMPPEGQAILDIAERVNNAGFLDEFAYQADTTVEGVSATLRGIVLAAQGQPLPIATNRWFWAPTRVLSEPPVDSGGAITEIPFFTFLYGDLHAHMIAMPMLLMAMAFIFNEVALAAKDERRGFERYLALAFGALTVGMLRATNTWDWITFMILGVVGLGFAWWLQWKRLTRKSLLHLVGRVGGFVLLSFIFVLPYASWYAATYNRALPWEGRRTPLWAYFDIHGLFLFLIFSLLVWDTARWFRTVYVRSLRGTWPLLIAGLLIVGTLLLALVLLALANFQVVLVTVPLIVWIALLFFRSGQSRPMQFVLALAGLGLALTLGVEFIVLDGDIGRQNTVFKFYIQAWMLFSVVGGVAFAWLLESSNDWSGKLRGVWFTVAALLFTITALYPLMASRAKALERFTQEMPVTLDGMDYMKFAQYGENGQWFSLESDYNMIRWLQENIQGTPTIMEGQSAREYLWSSRVSIYTGMPAVIGWNWHQRQQRTFDPLPRLVQQRIANVNAFYTVTDIPTAWQMITHYNVSYIIVGDLEKAYYPIAGLEKFDAMVDMGLLDVVYREGSATVYQVRPGATLAELG
jgi:YYY domain-containing protein